MRTRVFALRALPSALALFASVALLGGTSSCVAQEKYQDMERAAQHYQDRLHATEEDLASSRRETRAPARDARHELGAVAMATSTEDIDERLAALRASLESVGQGNAALDIDRFDVEGGYVLRVTDRVLFALGSSTVSEEGRVVLRKLAEDINREAHGTIFVRGHTDDVPIAKPETKARFPHGNLQLSTARAVEVASFLTSEAAVDPASVVVMGFGQWSPVVPNDSAAGRQRNRRVDIFVADPASSQGQ